MTHQKPATIELAQKSLQRLIWKLAHKFKRNIDIDILIGAGNEGLAIAYNKFDGEKNAKFSTYAYYWIWAYIKEEAERQWNHINNTAAQPIEEYDLGSYEMPLDDKIDYDRKMAKLDSLTRSIITAYNSGFNYRQISEALTAMGKPMTLHQIRRQHLAAMAD